MTDDQDRRDDPNAVLATGDSERSGAGVTDDLEGGKTGATSMTGGDRGEASTGGGSGNDPSPGGRTNAAGDRQGAIGTESYGGSPTGESGGGEPRGPAADGSFASGTYNERGNATGPDSPAGADVKPDAEGEGQGDDLANRLGGGDGNRTGLTGAGAATGDMNADRSEATAASAQSAAGAGGPSAGDVGGMGGVRGHTGGSGRPPGGSSPLQSEQGTDE